MALLYHFLNSCSLKKYRYCKAPDTRIRIYNFFFPDKLIRRIRIFWNRSAQNNKATNSTTFGRGNF